MTMDAVGCTETSVTNYQTNRRHNWQDHSKHLQGHKSLKFLVLCNTYPEDGGSVWLLGGVVMLGFQCIQCRTSSMTNTVVQNPLWEANSRSTGQNISCIRWVPKVGYRCREPSHCTPSCCNWHQATLVSKIHLNITVAIPGILFPVGARNTILYASHTFSHIINYFEQAAVFWNLRVSRDRSIQLGSGGIQTRSQALICLLVANHWMITDLDQ
jgi:hypothetical protein